MIALVELDEGVRMVGEVRRRADAEDRDRDAACASTSDRIDDELTLPIWRRPMKALEAGQLIPAWEPADHADARS